MFLFVIITGIIDYKANMTVSFCNNCMFIIILIYNNKAKLEKREHREPLINQGLYNIHFPL